MTSDGNYNKNESYKIEYIGKVYHCPPLKFY